MRRIFNTVFFMMIFATFAVAGERPYKGVETGTLVAKLVVAEKDVDAASKDDSLLGKSKLIRTIVERDLLREELKRRPGYKKALAEVEKRQQQKPSISTSCESKTTNEEKMICAKAQIIRSEEEVKKVRREQLKNSADSAERKARQGAEKARKNTEKSKRAEEWAIKNAHIIGCSAEDGLWVHPSFVGNHLGFTHVRYDIYNGQTKVDIVDKLTGAMVVRNLCPGAAISLSIMFPIHRYGVGDSVPAGLIATASMGTRRLTDESQTTYLSGGSSYQQVYKWDIRLKSPQ